MTRNNSSADPKKRNISVHFRKTLKRDNILFHYVKELPEKDLDFTNFSEYLKNLIMKDMQQRAALLGINISEIENMREVTTTTDPIPTVKRAEKPKATRAVKPEEFDDFKESLPEEIEEEQDVEELEIEKSVSDDKEKPGEKPEEKPEEEPIDYRKMADNFDF